MTTEQTPTPTTVTVRCPACTLEKTFAAGSVLPSEWTTEDGDLRCPNCNIPMTPRGEADVQSAEQAFAEAQHVLANTAPPDRPSRDEIREKSLYEINLAHGRVMAAQDRYETKHDAAKEAKKHLDNEIESFLTLTGRLSADGGDVPLPLFTPEAEQAAAPDVPMPGETLYTGLFELLTAAGYQAVTLRDLSAWTPEQRLEATTWAKETPTQDAMPVFMRELADAVEASNPPRPDV